MRVVVLMENTCGDPAYEYEHGLSVYVETDKHKVLSDTGASDKTLINAERLGVNLSKVDTLVLSHGHYDHSGAIMPFAKMNPTAKIYLRTGADKDFYHGEDYIGIDKEIMNLPTVVKVEGDLKIDDELYLFTNIKGRRDWPQGNKVLSEVVDGKHVQDEFEHEQCLVIRGEKNVLISGCAHNGILNIMDRYKEIFGDLPDVIISGFHMMKPVDYTEEEKQTILDTARELAEYDVAYYTGHCTGQPALDLMKPILKDKLVQLHSGMQFEI